ncbi:c-type cytochrome [Emcibacter nanhaiensis]|nr:cytochrome c [Emcibacter nanhaiensis]
MKRKAGRLLAITLLSGLFTICARGEEAAMLDGKALFHEKCAMCHRVMGMGTGLLARRVDEPFLEKRTDLTADYVIHAARSGIGNMPAIPRGEASDEQLEAIATYLAAGNAE